MTRFLKPLALAAVACLALAGTAEARTITRSGTVTGPNGTGSYSATRGCANGTCGRTATATGPNGKTASASRSATCANGTCSSSATATGPNGNSVSRSGSATVTHN